MPVGSARFKSIALLAGLLARTALAGAAVVTFAVAGKAAGRQAAAGNIFTAEATVRDVTDYVKD